MARKSDIESSLSHDPPESATVIPLNHNEGYVFGNRIQNHNHAHPKTVPQKEKRCEEDYNPMGHFRPAGLDQKVIQIGIARILQPFLWKTPVLEESRTIRDMLLPPVDFEEFPV